MSEDRKRLASASPEGGRVEKQSREQSPTPNNPGHPSVWKYVTSPQGPTGEIVDTASASGATTPVSPHSPSAISPVNLLLSESNMDMLSKIPENSKYKKNINCAVLYNMIIGQEERLFNLEEENKRLKVAREDEIRSLQLQLLKHETEIQLLRDKYNTPAPVPALPAVVDVPPVVLAPVPAALGEIADMKLKHAQDIADLRREIAAAQPAQVHLIKEDADVLITAKRELPLLSDGLQELEGKLEAMGTRLDGFEEVVNMVERATPTGVTPAAAQPTAVADGIVQADQVRGRNLTEIDQELQKVELELNSVNRSAKLHRRRAHLETESARQYSMRDSIKIFGIPFNTNENTNDIVRRVGISIGVHVGEHDISVSHRTGRANGSAPRPIIAKFTRRDVKSEFIRLKRNTRFIKTDDNLTPVKVFIDEHLTPMRVRVCQQLRTEKVPHYIRDGKVYILHEEGGNIRKVIDTPEDWEQLDIPDTLKETLLIYPRD